MKLKEAAKIAGAFVSGFIGIMAFLYALYWGLWWYTTALPWPCPEWRCPAEVSHD